MSNVRKLRVIATLINHHSSHSCTFTFTFTFMLDTEATVFLYKAQPASFSSLALHITFSPVNPFHRPSLNFST